MIEGDCLGNTTKFAVTFGNWAMTPGSICPHKRDEAESISYPPPPPMILYFLRTLGIGAHLFWKLFFKTHTQENRRETWRNRRWGKVQPAACLPILSGSFGIHGITFHLKHFSKLKNSQWVHEKPLGAYFPPQKEDGWSCRLPTDPMWYIRISWALHICFFFRNSVHEKRLCWLVSPTRGARMKLSTAFPFLVVFWVLETLSIGIFFPKLKNSRTQETIRETYPPSGGMRVGVIGCLPILSGSFGIFEHF